MSDHPFYKAVRFDAEAERVALERLVEGERVAARRILVDLIGRLRTDRSGPEVRQLVLLIGDILHRVNLELRRQDGDEPRYRANRFRIIRELASVTRADEAADLATLSLDVLLGESEPHRSTPHPLIERARVHIEAHYSGRIFLSSIADALHVSPNYLSRLFRRETGMTLTAYIQRVRLDHARRMLAEGERRISEIAYRVGYQTYRDFYRNFVKYEKASPREARRRLTRGSRRKDLSTGY